MIDIQDNTILITKEDGTTDTWRIYFYYHNPERNKDFYFIFKDEDPDSLIVMASSDGKELSEVTPEEFQEAQEMLDTYENDPKIQTLK
jgi:hypothetical protein